MKEQEVQKDLNTSIISIRVKLQNIDLKKSGANKFAGFKYFELGDFLPTLNKLMLEEGVNDRFTIENDEAKLELIKKDEVQEYKMPFKIFDTPLNKSGQPSMQDIQYLGALNTYYKRYLYLNAFGITDGEVIDAMNNDDLAPNKGNAPKPSATPKTTPKEPQKQATKDDNKDVSLVDVAKDILTNREKLINLCKGNNIDINDVAKEFKLNAKSTDADFLIALVEIEKRMKEGNK